MPVVIEKIYRLKKRAPEKKCIVLIGDWGETQKFGVDSSKFKIPESTEPTTFVLDDIAFRVPGPKKLRDLLLATGPLIAPSANPEGLPPVKKIAEAKKYFGEAVDFYASGKTLSGKPSRIIRLHEDGSVDILRG
jgi:L-threonylcarbamoyladenylate synthase